MNLPMPMDVARHSKYVQEHFQIFGLLSHREQSDKAFIYFTSSVFSSKQTTNKLRTTTTQQDDSLVDATVVYLFLSHSNVRMRDTHRFVFQLRTSRHELNIHIMF